MIDETKLGSYLNNRIEQKFLDKTFSNIANHKRDLLLRNLQIQHQIHQNVVIGDDLIQKTLDQLKQPTVITDSKVFPVFKEKYNLSFKNIFHIDNITGNTLKILVNENHENIVGIGGGRVMDILKFVQMQTGTFCLAIPTSLASHVYASPKIHALTAIKEFGYESTIDGPTPDLVILETPFLEKLQKDIPRLIKAGLGDIMAFVTAVEDWKLAGKYNTTNIDENVMEICQEIINKLSVIDVNKPLSLWIEDYVFIQVLLCEVTRWVGSAPASGSEHLFALAAEKGFNEPPLHGELVALGTLIMTKIHNSDCKEVHSLIRKLGLPTRLSEIGLTKEQAILGLQNSVEIARKKGRFTIINTINLNQDYCKKVIEDLLQEGWIQE